MLVPSHFLPLLILPDRISCQSQVAAFWLKKPRLQLSTLESHTVLENQHTPIRPEKATLFRLALLMLSEVMKSFTKSIININIFRIWIMFLFFAFYFQSACLDGLNFLQSWQHTHYPTVGRNGHPGASKSNRGETGPAKPGVSLGSLGILTLCGQIPSIWTTDDDKIFSGTAWGNVYSLPKM